jgi:hypothetical protein
MPEDFCIRIRTTEFIHFSINFFKHDFDIIPFIWKQPNGSFMVVVNWMGFEFCIWKEPITWR